MSNLLLIPLEDTVVFPNMSVTLTIDVGEADRVFLVPVHDGEYASIGTVAEVSGALRLPGGGSAVTLNGLHRGVAGAAHTGGTAGGELAATARAVVVAWDEATRAARAIAVEDRARLRAG